jgi:hypothetical protein
MYRDAIIKKRRREVRQSWRRRIEEHAAAEGSRVVKITFRRDGLPSTIKTEKLDVP